MSSTMLANIAVAWTRAWGSGDTAAFENLAAEDYSRLSKSGTQDVKEVVRQIEEFHKAFTDAGVEIIHAIDDGELIAIYWRTSGKHTGEFMGVPPTGRTVSVDGATFLTHRKDKIVEESLVWDPRDLLSSMKIVHLGTQSKAS